MEFTLSIVTIYMATGLSFNDLTKIVTLKQQIFLILSFYSLYNYSFVRYDYQCYDTIEDCSSYVSAGWCRSTGYVITNCRRSCGLCNYKKK